MPSLPSPVRPPVLLAAAALLLSACAPTRPAGPAPGEDAGPTAPAYETFDAATATASPSVRVTVAHDVPPRVMAGRVNVPNQAAPPPPREPVERQVDGYRVQVFSSVSRDAAEQTRAGLATWWTRARLRSGAPAGLETRVAYIQPYYRVRVGGFATREEAERALAFVRTEYPEAFLVPDTVTVID